jgi:HAD superfamily phosphatase (TIGR01681 family)
VLPEAAFFGLRADDLEGHQAVFREACEQLRLNLHQALLHHRAHGMRCYVTNFLVPQQNPTGRMLPRYSLGNLVHMVEELNRHLWAACEGMPGVQVVDADAVSATIGRRYVQDDSVYHGNHGGLLGPIALWQDAQRIEPVGEVDLIYTRRTKPFIQTVLQEVLAMHRTLLQQDSVKIVVFDLDDTLWRGVAAEQDRLGGEIVEGWPLGLLEAVAQLWRRGVLVALVSKNDEAVAREAWRQLYQSRFPLENFVALRINWAPKAQNIREILEAVNLLPESAVFVDDNPLERNLVREALPGLRVIEAPTAEWRRILLWSAETQRAEVNREALARTGMVQAQIRREKERGTHWIRAAFLEGLDLRVELGTVASEGTPPSGAASSY